MAGPGRRAATSTPSRSRELGTTEAAVIHTLPAKLRKVAHDKRTIRPSGPGRGPHPACPLSDFDPIYVLYSCNRQLMNDAE